MVFEIETGVKLERIESPILFNIALHCFIRKLLEETKANGVKKAHSHDFHSPTDGQHKSVNVIDLASAVDRAIIGKSPTELEQLVQIFEILTQKYDSTMNIKKTVIISLKQSQQDSTGRSIKEQVANQPDLNMMIRNGKMESTESFIYLGCCITKDQKMEKKIRMRISKASVAFNVLKHCIWRRKSMSYEVKLRIFRACVVPMLLYGREVWTLTNIQERRLNSFYMKCLRTIIGANLEDRLSNAKILEHTGQPGLDAIMRRNRLRWFNHVNRMKKVNRRTNGTKETHALLFYGWLSTSTLRN